MSIASRKKQRCIVGRAGGAVRDGIHIHYIVKQFIAIEIQAACVTLDLTCKASAGRDKCKRRSNANCSFPLNISNIKYSLMRVRVKYNLHATQEAMLDQLTYPILGSLLKLIQFNANCYRKLVCAQTKPEISLLLSHAANQSFSVNSVAFMAVTKLGF